MIILMGLIYLLVMGIIYATGAVGLIFFSWLGITTLEEKFDYDLQDHKGCTQFREVHTVRDHDKPWKTHEERSNYWYCPKGGL